MERDYKKHIKNVERSTRNAERFKSSKMAEKAKTNRAKVEKAYKIRKKQLKTMTTDQALEERRKRNIARAKTVVADILGTSASLVGKATLNPAMSIAGNTTAQAFLMNYFAKYGDQLMKDFKYLE